MPAHTGATEAGMAGDFAGRHVVVTGGTGALGAAVVQDLVERGAVCHLPVRGEPGDRFAGLPTDRVVWRAPVDLTDEPGVRAFYETVPELWASVHCAGGFAMSPLSETSLDDLTAQWRINAVSAFLCCREAARVMRAHGRGGRIVNVASRQALEPRIGSGMLAYSMSKAAIAALTQGLAEELAADGIWVNAVVPSILDTPANRQAMPKTDPSRWARVEDVASTIAFLASPRNGAGRGALVTVYAKT